MAEYERPQATTLRKRLGEPVRWLNVVIGPRRVGKTTLVRSVLREHSPNALYVSTDPPGDADAPDPSDASSQLDSSGFRHSEPGETPNAAWLIRQWQHARRLAAQAAAPFVFAIDEIQKVPRWSDVVKGLWDEDRANALAMHVVLLGSSPLLVQRGTTESLMGRFEPLPLGHWSYPEMHTAFGFALDEYIYFGGYPEPAASGLIRDEARWRRHVADSLIEPSISKDVFALNRVDRPALLKQLFWLGCDYSTQIMPLENMAQNLREKDEDGEAHVGTVAKYLDLLGKAGLLVGLQKYSGSRLRLRTSSPKLLALNNALMSVASGYDFGGAKADRTHWGRMVETAVGAHLYNSGGQGMLSYWRKGRVEVDFVLARGRNIVAIEVKAGRAKRLPPGIGAFAAAYPNCKHIVVSDDGLPLVEFLSRPAEHWFSER